MTYEADVKRWELVRESIALLQEVDGGMNTTADPQLVRLARSLVEADEIKTAKVAEAMATVSRVRAEGGMEEEQEEEAARPNLQAMRDIDSEMDRIIADLAGLAGAA